MASASRRLFRAGGQRNFQGQPRGLRLQHGEGLGVAALGQQLADDGTGPIGLAQFLVTAGLSQAGVESAEVVAVMVVEIAVFFCRLAEVGLVLGRAGIIGLGDLEIDPRQGQPRLEQVRRTWSRWRSRGASLESMNRGSLPSALSNCRWEPSKAVLACP